MERERRCTVKKRHPYGKKEAFSEKMTPVWKEALYIEKHTHPYGKREALYSEKTTPVWKERGVVQ